MDDIKRPKHSRPQVTLPTRRQIDLSATLFEGGPKKLGVEPITPAKDKRVIRVRLRLGVPAWVLRLHGKLVRSRASKRISRYLPSRRKYPTVARIGWGLLALLMVGSVIIEFLNLRQAETSYALSSKAQTLLSQANPLLASSLKLDARSGKFLYNEGYRPGGEVAGQVATPKFTASFSAVAKEGATVTDPVNQVSVGFRPEFALAEPRQDQNRLIYPLKGRDAVKVYSLKSIGMKEDIILNSFQGDQLSFMYKLDLAEGTEARMESNGSLAIYGAQKELLGNVSTGTEKDAELLKKARENATKKMLLFTFPAPFVREFGKEVSDTKAWFELKGSELTLHASGLEGASYPLSVDPSVYIETAAKLMRGNNETNVDFDVDNQLIQKSQTTGARIDEWTGTLGLNESRWNHGVAAAGGYVYSVGGVYGATSDDTAAYVRSNGSTGTSTTLDIGSAGTNRLVVVMADDESTGTNLTGATVDGKACDLVAQANNSSGAGNHQEMWYCDEDNLGSSNGTVTVAITGGDASWAVHAHLYTGVSQSGPSDSGVDTTSVGGSTVTVNGIDVPQNGLVVMGAGNGQTGTWNSWTSPLTERTDSPNPTSAVLGTASGIETAAQTNKTYVATASVADILRGTGIVASWDHGLVSSDNETRAKVFWAHFNTSNSTVESPNPGNGACTNWCTNSAYDLPDERAGLSVVAYNGFLYAIGGTDDAGTRSNDIYIAKLGANGEPSLWHPTDTNPNNWVYWFQSAGTDLSSERSYTAAVAYNNRLYVLGGQTNASSGGVTTVEVADILPNGKPGSWTTTGMQALPGGAGRHMHSIQVYNNVLYTIGGFEGAATSSANLRSTVYYSKLNTDGTMNAWQSTSGFTAARGSFGGAFTAIWGAYIYLGGGCTAVNASGYCTTISSDMQLASLNADGTISQWGSLGSLQNQLVGYSFIAWQNGLYRLGGCSQQSASTGDCTTTLSTVDYGVVNPAGEVSTVNVSSPYNSSTEPCDDTSPRSCDLPTVGDDAGEIGHMLSMTAILNGYLYVIGGCAEYNCNTGTNSPTADNISSNTAYVAIAPDGTLNSPPSCGGSTYGAWCIDNTNLINGIDGVAAAGVTVFNGRIYVVGGIDSSGSVSGDIYYNTVDPSNGSLGTWTSQTLSSIGVSENIFYTYTYARANPSQAGTYPGNFYIFGGCGNGGSGAGCGASDYETEVYKCWIETGGAIENTAGSTTYDCTTTGQLQIDSTPGSGGTDGLGIHSGTVYANYIYLVGGFSQAESDKDDVLYARFDNNNDVVAASGTTWIESPNKLSVGRRRGFSFGYNGHIYSVGGYDADGGGQIIPFIEWSKMNVSDGSIDVFETSSITINQRWGLSMTVSNGYAYVIGGCDAGASPSNCSSFEPAVQTFQLYNNDSGAVNNFTANANNFTTATDRIGASAAVLNGYLYVAGGCTTNTSDTCTVASSSVQYAQISSSDGTLGTWSAGGSLPDVRAWGSLAAAGGTLYYMGGQTSTATSEQSTVYYTTGISSGNPTWSGSAATNGLPAARTRFSSAVWNDRLYVVGGLDSSAAVTNTVYVSPQLSSGGDISSAWSTSSTAFNIARTGAAVTAYANNLYLFGGFDGTNYLSDVQFSKIDGSTGNAGSWTYTTSLPGSLRDATALSANGYIYLVNGRSAATTCAPKTLITPVSANTTIVSGNNPTGIGEWYETNVKYAGNRYGAAVAYEGGKIYTMGGGCVAPLSSDRHYYSTVKSQPQVAKYSRMIDTDTDVFPNSWLMNGVDNSIGARWTVRYRSMNDTDGVATDCGTADMTTWGQETNFGEVTLGNVEVYTPKDGSGNNINCARYFYFFVSIDASKTFGYPEDVARGPTINDLSLFFTSDPSKRLRHGKTFTGGEQQPLDTPCRVSGGGTENANCPLP